MEFWNSYKRLDNLCRDINGKGVTGYIEDMEKNLDGAYCVSGWNRDYKTLKHYRYIRNQIAHESYASEENMCSPEDALWLKDFYQRIMTQSDPLALYRQAKRNIIPPKRSSTGTAAAPIQNSSPIYNSSPVPAKKNIGCAAIVFSFVLIALSILWFIFK